jgi:hypothetical protein
MSTAVNLHEEMNYFLGENISFIQAQVKFR